MDDQDAPMENWKQFQGSELGSLMASLYGGAKSRPQINYPKPTQKPGGHQPGKWLPLGNAIDSEDPRKVTRRSVTGKLTVPRVGQGERKKYCLIDYTQRKKDAETIELEMEDLKMRQAAYRPAHTRAIGDAEKDRLGQVFGYKGGHALPKELTVIPTQAPYEIEARHKKIAQMAARRGPGAVKPQRIISHQENMANQITAEIDERMEYIEAMKGNGLSKEENRKLELEIQVRVRELTKLEEANGGI